MTSPTKVDFIFSQKTKTLRDDWTDVDNMVRSLPIFLQLPFVTVCAGYYFSLGWFIGTVIHLCLP